MPSANVQEFVTGKRGDGEPNRVDIGDRNRMPIPVTKLDRDRATPVDMKLSQASLFGIPGVTLQRRQRDAVSKPADHEAMFDTDAEGFDDTVTVSSAAESKLNRQRHHARSQSSRRSWEPDMAEQRHGTRDDPTPAYVAPEGKQDLGPVEGEGSSEYEDDEESQDDSRDDESTDDACVNPSTSGVDQVLLHTQSTQQAPQRTKSLIRVLNDHRVSSGVLEHLPLRRSTDEHPQSSERSLSKRSQVADLNNDGLGAWGYRGKHPSKHQSVSQLPSSSVNASGLGGDLGSPAEIDQLNTSNDKTVAVSADPLWRVYSHPPEPEASREATTGNHYTTAKTDLKTRKRVLNLDYNLEQLSGMAFKVLRDEPFDSGLPISDAVIPSNLVNVSLSQRLDHIYSMGPNGAYDSPRMKFFLSLSLDQYEECGDLILDRFTSIISKYKDARRQKRKAAKSFEEEVAKRVERVCEKRKIVEKDLGRLRRAGEDAVRG